MTTARKTYVVSFYDEQGHYRQEYYQNQRVAQKRARDLGISKGKANLSHWIDGAEMIRLARLGYVYDSSSETVKHSKHANGFIEEIDKMSPKQREAKFLDYRKFKTIDDVMKFHQAHR